MLALLTQKLALAHAGPETALVAACVVTAQLVSVPTALLVGARADTWGRKPLLLTAFAALPRRGVLYTMPDEPAFLIAVQASDGIALRILDALIALVLADIMRGTGRYKTARGLVGTVQGWRVAEQRRSGPDRRQSWLRHRLPDARSGRP
jgi:MFS family permease